MIEDSSGDMFTSGAEALVNPVNTMGSMGKGLALEFSRRFPAINAPYKAACRSGALRPGTVLITPTGVESQRFVIHFPTKRDPRDPSRLRDVKDALPALVNVVKNAGIASVAVPALGCGLGGLDWAEVRPLIVEAFYDSDGRVLLYPPK